MVEEIKVDHHVVRQAGAIEIDEQPGRSGRLGRGNVPRLIGPFPAGLRRALPPPRTRVDVLVAHGEIRIAPHHHRAADRIGIAVVTEAVPVGIGRKGIRLQLAFPQVRQSVAVVVLLRVGRVIGIQAEEDLIQIADAVVVAIGGLRRQSPGAQAGEEQGHRDRNNPAMAAARAPALHQERSHFNLLVFEIVSRMPRGADGARPIRRKTAALDIGYPPKPRQAHRNGRGRSRRHREREEDSTPIPVRPPRVVHPTPDNGAHDALRKTKKDKSD